MLYAARLQNSEALKNLLLRHAEFRVLGIIHDRIRDFEISTGVIAKTERLRKAPERLPKLFDV